MQRQPQATTAAARKPERPRRLPIGAEIIERRVEFRVWAPGHHQVELVVEEPEPQTIEMAAEDESYFAAILEN
ncbi:MAG: hypothetical protein ACM3VT_19410, partial [Solirubrobacterales bacterium]